MVWLDKHQQYYNADTIEVGRRCLKDCLEDTREIESKNIGGIIIRKCCQGSLCNNEDKNKIFEIFLHSIQKLSNISQNSSENSLIDFKRFSLNNSYKTKRLFKIVFFFSMFTHLF